VEDEGKWGLVVLESAVRARKPRGGEVIQEGKGSSDIEADDIAPRP